MSEVSLWERPVLWWYNKGCKSIGATKNNTYLEVNKGTKSWQTNRFQYWLNRNGAREKSELLTNCLHNTILTEVIILMQPYSSRCYDDRVTRKERSAASQLEYHRADPGISDLHIMQCAIHQNTPSPLQFILATFSCRRYFSLPTHLQISCLLIEIKSDWKSNKSVIGTRCWVA